MVRFWKSIGNISFAFVLLCACTPGRTINRLNTSVPSPLPQQEPTANLPTSITLVTPTRLAFDGPLSVKIYQPADNEILDTATVLMTGEADPGTVININENILLIDDSHTFSVEIALESGINLIEITASDAQNNQDFAYLTLYYETEE